MSQSTNTEYVILYFHGGGLNQGSSITHRKLGSYITNATNIPVLIHNYPLAPEHPYPEALHYSEKVYQWLLNKGYTPEHILFGGDSTGCALELALMLLLKERKMTLPKGAFLLSPMLDFTLSGQSMKTCVTSGPCLFVEDIQMTVNYYCSADALEQPYISPIFGEYSQFPPLLIQVGSDELLLSDSIRLAEKAKEAGVYVRLDVWQDMWHIFQTKVATVPEAKQAIEGIREFIYKVINKE